MINTKKLIIVFAIGSLVAAAYVLGAFRSSTTISVPAGDWAKGSEAAAAWQELGVSFQAAGARVLAASSEPVDQVEGIDFLSDLLSLSLEMKYSKGSRAHPQFTDWMGDHRKAMGDSPDAIYLSAEISPDAVYEISGNRNDAEYFGVMLYGRALNGWNRAAANLTGQNIRFDGDGNFRIRLGAGKAESDGANWMQLEADTHMVMVRQYFHDRTSKTPATVKIRNLNPPNYTRQTDADVAASLRAATTFFNEASAGTLALAEMLQTKPNSGTPPKAYNPDFGGIFYPTDDNQYHGTWIAVEQNEALIVEGVAPDADYWSVSLQNRWLQTLDYEHRQTSLTNHEVDTVDGRYRIIIAHEDPGIGNWLDLDGHRSGLLAIRYQLADKVPPPDIKLVKFSEVAE